jgi:hypothetical protein
VDRSHGAAGRTQRFSETDPAIAGANFPFAVALGDEILGTKHRDFPAGDEQGGDAATTPVTPNRSSEKQNRPQEIPGAGVESVPAEIGTFVASFIASATPS